MRKKKAPDLASRRGELGCHRRSPSMRRRLRRWWIFIPCNDALDVFQQPSMDRASRRIRRPTDRPEASAHLPFRLFRRSSTDCRHRRCAFGDGVPSAQNPGRPGVVALGDAPPRREEPTRSRTRTCHGVPRCVSDFRASRRSFRQRHRAAPQNGTKIAHQRQEPRTGVSEHQCGVIEQAFRVFSIAGHERDPRQPGQCTPGAPWDRERPELVNAAGKQMRAALTLPAASSTCPNTYDACASIANRQRRERARRRA